MTSDTTFTPPSKPARPRRARVRRGAIAGLASLAALLASTLQGCAEAGPALPDAPLLRQFGGRGYGAAERHEVHASSHTWVIHGQPAQVQLTLPSGPTPMPLVVYLPGLGESATAGSLWRDAWAAAGYAVLCVQPLGDDAQAWTSDLARTGEFRALGQRHFAAAALQARSQRLTEILDEARRRGTEGESGFASIDWTRVALAGYDLGAHTVSMLAGEGGPAGTRGGLRAVIALSPIAAPVEAPQGTANGPGFASIKLPVLSVSSDADDDALGLIDGAWRRRQPHEQMAAGDKWLLWLTGLHHLQVSGTPAAGGLVLAAAARAREAERESRGGPGDFGMRRGAGPGGNDMPIEPAGRPAASARTLGAFRGLPATDVELRMIAIQQVSVAFLDAYVRRTAPARQWLAQEAGPWVAGLGELSQR